MSESSPAPAASQPAAAVVDPTQVPPGMDAAQWANMLAEFNKQGGMPGFAGAMPFPMAPFQTLMYPGFMLPGFMPGFGLPAGEGGEGKAEGEGSGEDDTDDDDEAAEEDDGDSSGKEGGRPKRKRATRGGARKKAAVGDGVVKSNSNAALAMLAGAAATKPGAPGANPAAAAAMHPGQLELWAGALNGGAGGMPATTSQLDLSKLTSEQQQQIMAAGSYEGVSDERELKKLRRKQSNRESARRSRLRKQHECEQLGKQVKELLTENARLKEEKMSLMAQIEILNAKLSMSAFSAVHAMGGQGGDLSKMADMQAKQTADMQNMAAAMAQAMQVNGGAAMMGIPSLDAKALEGDEAAAAAAAAAAAGAVGDEQQAQAE